LGEEAGIEVDISCQMQLRLVVRLPQPIGEVGGKDPRAAAHFAKDRVLGEGGELVFEDREHEEGVIAGTINILELIFFWEHVVLQKPQFVRGQQSVIFVLPFVHDHYR
jgi:hypothetical protein